MVGDVPPSIGLNLPSVLELESSLMGTWVIRVQNGAMAPRIEIQLAKGENLKVRGPHQLVCETVWVSRLVVCLYWEAVFVLCEG